MAPLRRQWQLVGRRRLAVPRLRRCLWYLAPVVVELGVADGCLQSGGQFVIGGVRLGFHRVELTLQSLLL